MIKRCVVPFSLAVLGMAPLHAQAPKPGGSDAQLQDLLELLNTPVVSASKTAEKLSDAPATMIVLKRDDLLKRGYTEVSQLLDDLVDSEPAQPHGQGLEGPREAHEKHHRHGREKQRRDGVVGRAEEPGLSTTARSELNQRF